MAKGPKIVLNTLSDGDLSILRELIRDKKSRNKNPGHKRYDEKILRGPDTYIIRLPYDGLPERDVDDIVQPVDCAICFFEEDGDDLVLTEGEEIIPVYNPYSHKWFNYPEEHEGTAPVYLLATRHKQGHWLCEKPPMEYLCKATGSIAADGSGDTEILLEPSGAAVDTVTGYNDWMTGGLEIPEDAEGIVRFFEYEKKWRWVEVECTEE